MFSSAKNNPKATVVDGALVVSFQSAEGPRVWRFDMGKFISTALEMREEQDGFSLVMKAGNSPEEKIGTFPNKKKATEMLESITAALLKGREILPPVKTGGGFLKFLKFVFLLLIIASIFLVLSKTRMPAGFKEIIHVPGNTAPVMPAPKAAAPPAAKTGVPLPADEVFGQ